MSFATDCKQFTLDYVNQKLDNFYTSAIVPYAVYLKRFGKHYSGSACGVTLVNNIMEEPKEVCEKVCGSLLEYRPSDEEVEEYLPNVPDATGWSCHFMGRTLEQYRINTTMNATFETINIILPTLEVSPKYGIPETEMYTFIQFLKDHPEVFSQQSVDKLREAGVPDNKIAEVIWMSALVNGEFLANYLTTATSGFKDVIFKSLGTAAVTGAALGTAAKAVKQTIEAKSTKNDMVEVGKLIAENAKFNSFGVIQAGEKFRLVAPTGVQSPQLFNTIEEATYAKDLANARCVAAFKTNSKIANAARNKWIILGVAATIGAAYIGSKLYKNYKNSKASIKVTEQDIQTYLKTDWNGLHATDEGYIHGMTNIVNSILAIDYKSSYKDAVYLALEQKGIAKEEYENTIDTLLANIPKHSDTADKDRYALAMDWIEYI